VDNRPLRFASFNPTPASKAALLAATFKWFLSRITTTRGGAYEPVHHSAGIERLVLAARERRVVVATLVFFEFLAADKQRTIRDRRGSGARRPQ
jgi:hypothetical protein